MRSGGGQSPLNNQKLQQFLQPMKQLKQFYLYAKLIQNSIDYQK
jgi:hypothetical protein